MRKDLDELLSADWKNCFQFLIAALTDTKPQIRTEIENIIQTLNRKAVELEKRSIDLQNEKEELNKQLETALKTTAHHAAVSADNEEKLRRTQNEFSQIQELNKSLLSFFQKSYLLIRQKEEYGADDFVTKVSNYVDACKNGLVEDGYAIVDDYNDKPNCFTQSINGNVQTTVLRKPAIVRDETIIAHGLILVPSKDNNQSQNINISTETKDEQQQRKDIESPEVVQEETMTADKNEALNQSVL